MRRLQCLLALAVLMPLAGCHKRVVAVIPQPALPPLEMVSVPPPTHPTEPEPQEKTVEVIVEPVIPTPRPTPPRRRPAQAPTPPPTQTATAAAPPIDLGTLTAGGTDANNNLRQTTEELMRTQTRRLASVSAALAALHSQQVEQARLFLRQADDAWKKLDIDGAHTLAVKAKVLLDEVLQ